MTNIFNYNQNPVRTTSINNIPYFCLIDYCKALNIKQNRDTSKRLNEKGVVKTDILTNGGKQEATFINEPNLYRLIFRSNKPEAQKFANWVYEEVLPQIRQTGSYSLPNLKLIASAVVDELRAEGMLRRERTSQRHPLFDCKHVKVFAYKRLKPGENKILCADLYKDFCVWNEICHYNPFPLPPITEFIDTLDVIGYPICTDKDGNEFVKCNLIIKNKIVQFGGNFYNFVPCEYFNVANVYRLKDGRYYYVIGNNVRKSDVKMYDYDMVNNQIAKGAKEIIVDYTGFRDLVTHQKAGVYIRDLL